MEEKWNKKISVIHLKYAEKLLTEKHLDSLAAQTLSDCEFLFPEVPSDSIIISYVKKDKRFRITGGSDLNISEGRYILLSNGNEAYSPDFLEKAYDRALQTGSEILLPAGERPADHTGTSKEVFSRTDCPDSIFSAVSPDPGTKLFLHSFLSENKLEDLPDSSPAAQAYVLTAVCLAEKITYMNEAVPPHDNDQDLLSAADQTAVCDSLSELYALLKKHGVFEDVKSSFADHSVTMLSGLIRRPENESQLKSFVSRFLNETSLLDCPEEVFRSKADLAKVKGMYNRNVWHEKQNTDFSTESFRIIHDRNRAYHPAVSVIIPIYNAEPFLRECIESVIRQTFRNIEIICVNDGSADASLEIAREMAEQDERIIVCTQNNKGLSATRNNGIRIAEGEYLIYHDNDDLLTEDALECLYRRITSEDLDFLLFDGKRFIDDLPENTEDSNAWQEYLHYYDRKQEYSGIHTGAELMCLMRNSGEYRPNACLQMINREFFLKNGLWFFNGIHHEDNLYTFRCHLRARKAGHINRQFSLRRAHSNSMMTSRQRFDNVYGYYVGYVKGSAELAAIENSLTDEETAAARNVLAGMLRNARKIFSGLPEEEQAVRYELRKSEQEYFRLLVEDACRVYELQQKLKETQKEKSELNAKLQRTYQEKSELNAKLQSTYQEKSELNAKLQQTYKEKAERGQRIKELENESIFGVVKRRIKK
ncbi:MAG: glycosyltransferase [Solobacterium sp.]|nr:glycosyltransferase [Solobacterium sp.]